jgi:hypothetical protein
VDQLAHVARLLSWAAVVKLEDNWIRLSAVDARVERDVLGQLFPHALPVRSLPRLDERAVCLVVRAVNLPLALLAVGLRASRRVRVELLDWFFFSAARTGSLNGIGA